MNNDFMNLTFDSTMVTICITNILIVIRREMGPLITYSAIYCINTTARIVFTLDTHSMEYTRQALMILIYTTQTWITKSDITSVCLLRRISYIIKWSRSVHWPTWGSRKGHFSINASYALTMIFAMDLINESFETADMTLHTINESRVKQSAASRTSNAMVENNLI